jgi:uncharacterized protein
MIPLPELIGFLLTGALAGLLAGLFGVGGGVVIVPALILILGHLGFGGDWIPHLAVGSSLASIVATGAVSALAHHRHGAVRWSLVALLAPGILVGAWTGAALAGVLPDRWLIRVFAAFLTFVGVRMLLPRPQTQQRTMPGRGVLTLAGAAIGAVSAVVGIGGGTLTVPFLSSRGLNLRAAVATSAACGPPIALAGAAGFVATGWGREGLPDWTTGFVYWPAVGLILLASLPAAPLGARLAHAIPLVGLKRAFAVLVLVMAAHLALGPA